MVFAKTTFFYALLFSPCQEEEDEWLLCHVTHNHTEQSDNIAPLSPSFSIELHQSIILALTPPQSVSTKTSIIKVY